MTSSHPLFDQLLTDAVAAQATDLHVAPHQRPRMRVGGDLQFASEDAIAPDQTEAMAQAVFGERRIARQASEGCATLTFRISEERFARATLGMTRGAFSIRVRICLGSVPSMERVNAPPVLQELLRASHGLLIVAGPHGSGKTTTLYSLVDWINRERAVHICTVEDPIEYELAPQQALLQQREVGFDVPDVASGIAAAMEQDLDVLLVGGLASLEALSAALHAAETGHLVLVQLHADSARNALERIIEAAPEGMHPMIRRSLSETLVGVTCQRLIPREAGGRQAVYEVLVPNAASREGIFRGGSMADLPAGETSVSMREQILQLEGEGTISAEWAARARSWLNG